MWLTPRRRKVLTQCVGISCWLWSLVLETAGTHRGHEPSLTGHPHPSGMDSLWREGGKKSTLSRSVTGNTINLPNKTIAFKALSGPLPRWCWSLSEVLEREDRLEEGLDPTRSTWASWNSCSSLAASSKCCWPSSCSGSFLTILPAKPRNHSHYTQCHKGLHRGPLTSTNDQTKHTNDEDRQAIKRYCFFKMTMRHLLLVLV